MNGPLTIRQPARWVALPFWPDKVSEVIVAAIAGAKGPIPLAVTWTFPDTTQITLEYQLEHRPETPPSVYEHVGPPPLLSIIVFDNGIGIDRDGKFAREHQAEMALRDIALLLGKDNPKAVYGESINPAKTRRQYWWRVS